MLAGRKARSCREDREGRGISILGCQAGGQPGQPVGGTVLAAGSWGQSETTQTWAPRKLPLTPTFTQGNSSPCQCCAPQLLGASMGHCQWGWPLGTEDRLQG